MQKQSIFNNVYTSKYFKDLPDFKEKRTQAFITIALTLIALSFFGLFAINPTISTIFNLQKQKEDNTFVEEKLNQKLANLNTLTQSYANLTPDLPYIYRAIPQTPQVPQLVGQLTALGIDTNVQVNRVQTFEVDLTKPVEGVQGFSTVKVVLEVLGSYNNLMQYTKALASFERILLIDSISLHKANEKNANVKLNIQATAFFKQ
jgi:Tfp pilus assembly protein PilO